MANWRHRAAIWFSCKRYGTSGKRGILALARAAAIGCAEAPSSDRHFPVYDTVYDFIDPLNVAKREKWLSAIDLQILEGLKPYREGNTLLFALHQLDILRKHKRLISVHLMPRALHADSRAFREGLQFPAMWPGFEDGAVIAWTNIDSTHSEFQIPAEIAFNEADLVLNYPVISTLRQFASLADSIISQFE